MKYYHAHIYYTSPIQAESLLSKTESVTTDIFRVYKLHPKKVGPHLLPMIELHFNESKKEEVLCWLNLHRMEMSVLVHEDTGNDVEDHLSPIWLGEKLPIDFDFFEKVKQDA